MVTWTLLELRRRVGKKQAEVAAAMGWEQPAVSRMEREGTTRVSSIRKYLEALGMDMRIEALSRESPLVVEVRYEGTKGYLGQG